MPAVHPGRVELTGRRRGGGGGEGSAARRRRWLRRAARLACAAAAACGAGCGARTGLRCVELPAADAGEARGPDAAPVDGGDARVDAGVAPDAACAELLRVREVSIPPGCIVDVRVGREAVLRFPCGGGAATAVFDGDAAEVYRGTVADGRVDLLLETRFRPGDGCEWQSTQRIRGELASGSLAYTYEEAPVPLGRTGCLPPCPLSSAALIARAVDPSALDAGARADAGAPPCGP